MPRAPDERARLRRSLRASIAEGLAAELVGAFSGSGVLMAWALHLRASPLVIGLLAALPLATQVLHFPGAWLVSRFGARRVALVAVTASRQVLWPLAVLPFVSVTSGGREVLLVVVAGVSAALAIIGNNAWQTWMADLVPPRIRGRYFGWRTGVTVLCGAFGALAAGVLLDAGRATGAEQEVLSGLAALACTSGAVATLLMRRQHEPARVGVAPALSRLPDARVRRVLGFLVPWNIAVGLSGAYYGLYELRDMHLDFATVAALAVLTAGVRFVSAPMWGRAIDRHGVRPVLVTLSFAIALIPLPWMFATATVRWPVIVDAVLSGLLWSGHGLATSQLPLRVSQPPDRGSAIAACSAASGLAFGLATLAAGAFATEHTEPFVVGGRVLAPLQLLFLASSAVRLVAALLSIRVVDPGARAVREFGRVTLNSVRARFVA